MTYRPAKAVVLHKLLASLLIVLDIFWGRPGLKNIFDIASDTCAGSHNTTDARASSFDLGKCSLVCMM